MADQPDPPDEWRVYQSDPTPDPEPAQSPASAPARPPQQPRRPAVARSRSAGPKLVVVVIAVAVIGAGIAAVVAIVSAVSDSVGIGGIDAKDPDDFAEFVDELEDETGSTEVNWVGLYDGYIIADVPYTDDPDDNREISYSWRGGDIEESSRGTSTDVPYDLREIDPSVIDGMCDPVLDLAEGAEPGDCYIFISNPGPDSDVWFRTSAQDDFTISYWVNYDKDGNEVERGHN